MDKKSFTGVLNYFKSLINIDKDCDAQATINNISQNIEFKGLNAWILIFAIFLASIGLNVNSTAVIIGAMLVSPLMGPIIGIGLSIGINDLKLLKKSLKNLFIMTAISLLVSTVYFLLTPLSDAQSELLARTRPTIFDVLIATFGGFAGIVASSRTQEKTTVVSGVAIATALMPPLCTAGYGIGTGQMNYFFGAFYLFFINSFFIALATFLIVKYLKFPEKDYVDDARRRRVRHYILLFSLIVMIPSVFIALGVIKETAFNSASIKYVNSIEQSELFTETQIIKNSRDFKTKTIDIAFVGKPLSDVQMQYLQTHLNDYDLGNVNLNIKQSGAATFDLNKQSELIQDLFEKKDAIIEKNEATIAELQKQIETIKSASKLSVVELSKEIHALCPSVEKVALGETENYDVMTNKSSKSPVVTLYWNGSPKEEYVDKITSWLRIRMNDSTVEVENK
ncbi:MAG: TIGR00341 family protein [Bacteroidales bacterium]|nr:TIGR00341 family protein [Bacteroidales bacterium]